MEAKERVREGRRRTILVGKDQGNKNSDPRVGRVLMGDCNGDSPEGEREPPGGQVREY